MLMISSIFAREHTVHQSYKPYVQNYIKSCFALILRQFPFGGAKTEGQALWRSISRSPDCNVTVAPINVLWPRLSLEHIYLSNNIVFAIPPPNKPTATRQNKLFVPILLHHNGPRPTLLVKRLKSFVICHR